jgi:sugar/nucleoside kinase (ribokinase family)
VVDHEERGKVLQALDGKNYKVTAGGSLSNTLVALARLGQGAVGPDGGELLAPLSVAMTGSVGSDPLGQFYR